MVVLSTSDYVLYAGFELCLGLFFCLGFLIQCKVHVWGVNLIPNKIQAFYIKKKNQLNKSCFYAVLLEKISMLWLSKLGLKVKPRFLTAPFWAQILQRPPLDYPWWGLPASCWVLPWVLQIIISSDGDTKCLRDEGALKCMFRYQICESMFSTQRSLHPRWKTCSGRCPGAWKWRVGAGLGNHWVHPPAWAVLQKLKAVLAWFVPNI